MESLAVAIGGTLLIVAIAWVASPDIVGAIILKYTLEPATRWFMRAFFGVDRPVVGTEALVGLKAFAVSGFTAGEDTTTFQGRVEVRSEMWSARAREAISAGTTVRVVSCQGVFLNVERVQEGNGV